MDTESSAPIGAPAARERPHPPPTPHSLPCCLSTATGTQAPPPRRKPAAKRRELLSVTTFTLHPQKAIRRVIAPKTVAIAFPSLLMRRGRRGGLASSAPAEHSARGGAHMPPARRARRLGVSWGRPPTDRMGPVRPGFRRRGEDPQAATLIRFPWRVSFFGIVISSTPLLPTAETASASAVSGRVNRR